MKLRLIACGSLQGTVESLLPRCGNEVDAVYLPQGLHMTPGALHEKLRRAVAVADDAEYDAVLLGYGRCGRGAEGLVSARHTLVRPRAHDCVTLFLGSRRRYRAIFDAHEGGVYWHTPAWIESGTIPSAEREAALRAEYTEKYGEENAEYLLRQETEALRRYAAAVYIAPPGADEKYRRLSKAAAAHYGWEWTEEPADVTLLRDFLAGRWDAERFRVAPPGQVLEE